jgi:hypothetical protein
LKENLPVRGVHDAQMPDKLAGVEPYPRELADAAPKGRGRHPRRHQPAEQRLRDERTDDRLGGLGIETLGR